MIRILIVDDEKILRECLRLAMNKTEKFTVAGCAGDGREAVELALRLKPDIVLMDLNMPVYSGYDAIRDIKALCPDVKILVLTVEGDEKNIAKAFLNGADGYVLKDICLENLSNAIRCTCSGECYVHESAFNISAAKTGADPKTREGFCLREALTGREKEVLGLLTEGLTNEEIADALGISAGRARNIVAELISKCMVKNRTQLAVIGVRIHMLTNL